MNDKEILEEMHEKKANFKKVLNDKKLDLFELDKLMAEA